MESAILQALSKTGPSHLIFTMPPRHGKSEFISHRFPVWLLEVDHNKRVILASYEADFAASWGAKVRNTINSNQDLLTVRVSPDSRAANRWNTAIQVPLAPHHRAVQNNTNPHTKMQLVTQIGGMTTAGVGGAINGRGADALLADDLIKNHIEAQSSTIRDSTWNWFQSTFLTRQEPGCIVIVVMTRWHEDDPVGRLQNLMADPNYAGIVWKQVDIPALAIENDQLGRKPGQALWPERFDEDYLNKIRYSDPAMFEALYQQSPTPPGGTVMNRMWWSDPPNVIHNNTTQDSASQPNLNPNPNPNPNPIYGQDGLPSKYIGHNRAMFPTRNRFDAQYAQSHQWPVIARFQSWDTALKDTERSAYTVCHTADLLSDYRLALRNTYRDKLTFDKMPDAIVDSAEYWRGETDLLNTVIIEDKASGISALQTLSSSAPAWLRDRIKAVPPYADKIARAKQAATWCRRGCVLLPTQQSVASWLFVFEDEFFKFPGSKYMDQMDAFAQLIIYLENFLSEGYNIRKSLGLVNQYDDMLIDTAQQPPQPIEILNRIIVH